MAGGRREPLPVWSAGMHPRSIIFGAARAHAHEQVEPGGSGEGGWGATWTALFVLSSERVSRPKDDRAGMHPRTPNRPRTATIYLRCRIFARMRRFLRPTFRRPVPR